jgi:hypothetical protein
MTVGDTSCAYGELVAAAQSVGLDVGNGGRGGCSVRAIRFSLREEDGLALGLAWAARKAGLAATRAMQKWRKGGGKKRLPGRTRFPAGFWPVTK